MIRFVWNSSARVHCQLCEVGETADVGHGGNLAGPYNRCYCWLFRVLHSVHRGVESSEKKCLAPLDIFPSYSKITNGSALPKSVGPCRGFTVGSEVLQGTDPIVRRLISTG